MSKQKPVVKEEVKVEQKAPEVAAVKVEPPPATAASQAKAVVRRTPAKAPAKVAAEPKPVASKAKPKASVTAKAKSEKPEAVAEAAPAKNGKAKKQVARKPKLVRDSFTIPEADYALFASLKERALAAGVEVKKGELLRAALAALNALSPAEFIKAVSAIERIKTGRPRK